MKHLTLLLIALLLFTACKAKTEPSAGTPETFPAVADSVLADSTAVVTPLVTFIELGAETCIPCKMMKPILKEIEEGYQGAVKVIFYDLYKVRDASQKYNVRVMPTQVFLDNNGKEFFRHEGFYPQAEIEKMLAEKVKLTKPDKKQ